MFLAVTVVASGLRAWAASDPLTTEIERWRAFLRDDRTAGVELLASLKTDIEPAMVGTEKALREGLTLLAFHRLAAVQGQLAAAAYLALRPATQRKDPMEFEKEWSRMGSELRTDLAAAPSPAALDGVRPAAVRAAGEAALSQVRVSTRRAWNTGATRCPRPGSTTSARPWRSGSSPPSAVRCRLPRRWRRRGCARLSGELDALEGELLVAYRPPASIDRHREFIAASAAIKEARELDAAGLRYGALLSLSRGACCALPCARATPRSGGARRWRGSCGDAEPARPRRGVDHSIGRVSSSRRAEADLDAGSAGDPPWRSAIVADVLPRYFAALEPAPPPPGAAASAAVTVTLVRWPYT